MDDDLVKDDTNTSIIDDTVATDAKAQPADILINMEGLIKNHLVALDRLAEELKKHKDMLDDIFTNDETYQQHLKQAEEANKVKAQTRTQVLKQPQAADLDKKVKEFKMEIKEHQNSLSDYLQEYQRMSGVNEIENDKGEMLEIVYSAKLIKKSSYQR